MDISAWIKSFREMHERARRNQLNPEEHRQYLAAREQFARSLVSAQGLSMDPGLNARRTFRVAHALPVELNLSTSTAKSMTQDISGGGFSCLLHRPPEDREQPGFSLKLPGGAEPLVGRARIASSMRRIGNYRVSFAFLDMAQRDTERLEMLLFDLALARLPT